MLAASAGDGGVLVREHDEPEVEPGGLLVRMAACGICGSDVEKVFGRYGRPSMRLGHEPAGTVEAVGPGTRGFEVGDRVFTHHHVPCYDCRLCSRGHETLCPRYSESNLDPCGLAEVYSVPEWNVSRGGVLRLADSTTFEEAALIEPLACCLRAWSRMPAREGDTAAIFGAGATGLMHAMIALSRGFSRVVCADTNRFRLGRAEEIGAAVVDASDPGRVGLVRELAGGGADVAVVAAGSMGALSDAADSVREGGHVMMFGVPQPGARISADMGAVYSREATLHTSYAASDRDTREALALIESSAMDVAGLVTHRYGLADSAEAFEHARGGGSAVKIVITGKA
ncbi:MAG: alcohol dehydrogenase catalytic domain-containing protein [Nitrosopumilus sp.]|nr:alcohol dehydrogenase catalytic domain-containing protein [Nitrosopumilus sp.]CAI9832492.1 Alcohol dehydrogenase zinc-binding domain protein [Nitrosopumilaceae archaeon]MDA7941514.1 alcohol dehydrogenase catalytic domain-containing protein [Nitrosopumilus sp.]MDA7943344.1 alcohol dehydrogenase catalytic domain-containing protein [Nitrosopumilus sp.]MDA7944792.1 alcohol dehydrogenase catalytic domain-containing protein [Nitrosopumilus sp.]